MKNLAAILLGIFLTFACLGVLEIFFQLNESYRWLEHAEPPFPPSTSEWREEESRKLYEDLHKDPIYQWMSPVAPEDGQRLIAEGNLPAHFANMPCCIGRRKMVINIDETIDLRTKVSNTLLARPHYTVDHLGRRITPKVKNPKYNILMFGDSYTYGVGVNNEESAPYQLGLRRPEAQVYNLGLGAGSPAQALYELTVQRDRLTDIRPLKTIILNTFMDNHLERIFCRSLCVSPESVGMSRLPYYALDGGEVKFKGFFDLNRPYINFIYGWMNKSATLKFFNVVWPLRFSEQHFLFFADLILEQQKKAAEQFPDVDFYLVLYPGGSSTFGKPLREAAEAKGIKVLDYSGLDMLIATGQRHVIEGDGHPSPIVQYIFGYLLDRDLPKPPP